SGRGEGLQAGRGDLFKVSDRAGLKKLGYSSFRRKRESRAAGSEQSPPVQARGRRWTPAFPTGLTRGLKAHGVTGWSKKEEVRMTTLNRRSMLRSSLALAATGTLGR